MWALAVLVAAAAAAGAASRTPSLPAGCSRRLRAAGGGGGGGALAHALLAEVDGLLVGDAQHAARDRVVVHLGADGSTLALLGLKKEGGLCVSVCVRGRGKGVCRCSFVRCAPGADRGAPALRFLRSMSK